MAAGPSNCTFHVIPSRTFCSKAMFSPAPLLSEAFSRAERSRYKGLPCALRRWFAMTRSSGAAPSSAIPRAHVVHLSLFLCSAGAVDVLGLARMSKQAAQLCEMSQWHLALPVLTSPCSKMVRARVLILLDCYEWPHQPDLALPAGQGCVFSWRCSAAAVMLLLNCASGVL